MFARWFLILLWLSLFAAAFFWLSRPEPESPVPQGWRRWTHTGALYALIPFREGVLAGGVQGLWYGERKKVAPFSPGVFPRATIVFALARDASGILWVGHSEGLSILRDGKWRWFTRADGIPRSPVRAIALDAGGAWIGGRDGLFRVFSEPHWSVSAQGLPETRKRQRKRNVNVSALLLDSSGGLWVGSNEAPEGGVYRLQGANARFWGTKEGLPHPQVTSFLEDRLGRVWAGVGFYDQGGAAVFERRSASGWGLSFTLSGKQLAGPKVRSLAQDRQGRYWIGSENSGVAIRDEHTTVATLRKEHGLPGLEVTQILQTADQAVWLATLKGLARIDITAMPAVPSGSVR